MPEQYPKELMDKMRDFTLDEKPAFINEQEKFFGYLEGDLQNISGKEFTEAKNFLQEFLSGENISDSDMEEVSDIMKALNYLTKLQSFSNKQKVIDEIAQTDVRLLARAERSASKSLIKNDKIRDAIYHLSRVVYNTSRSQFPDSYKKQEEFRTKKEEKDLEEARERIKRINIS